MEAKERGSRPRSMIQSMKRYCRFCVDSGIRIDYKEPKFLGVFISERGKIVPRRMTGNCAYHQRRITEAIKRARILALLAYDAGVGE